MTVRVGLLFGLVCIALYAAVGVCLALGEDVVDGMTVGMLAWPVWFSVGPAAILAGPIGMREIDTRQPGRLRAITAATAAVGAGAVAPALLLAFVLL